jgi:hypothetical protein
MPTTLEEQNMQRHVSRMHCRPAWCQMAAMIALKVVCRTEFFLLSSLRISWYTDKNFIFFLDPHYLKFCA